MNLSPDFNSVPLPTADTLMVWGFIIVSGILVAQISTKLSERFSQDDEAEDVAADETDQAEQQPDHKSEANEEVSQAEGVEEDEPDKDI